MNTPIAKKQIVAIPPTTGPAIQALLPGLPDSYQFSSSTKSLV